jgi:hypothetical protein
MPADAESQAAAATDTELPRAGENKHEWLSTGTIVFSKPAPPPPPPPHGRLTTSFGRPAPPHRISTPDLPRCVLLQGPLGLPK